MPDAKGAPKEILDDLSQQVKATQQGFIDSMDEDFNTAGALGQIFDLVRMINQARLRHARMVPQILKWLLHNKPSKS